MTVFAPVATATQELISSVIERQTSNPAPILRQLGANAVAGYQSFMSTPPAWLIAYALTDVVVGVQEFGPNLNNFATVTSESLTALATILGDMGEGLPALLQAVGAQLAAGNPNGAIDAIMLAGLQPGVDLLMKVLTPEMNAIGQLLRVPQPITDAMTNAVIGVALGAIASTVGIGFDLGDPQPVVKGFIAGVQTVLDGAASGDPATFVNAVQHGVAKFALDVIGQAGQMHDSINYAVDGFVDALKQIAPKPFTPPDVTIPTAKALVAPAPAALAAGSVVDALSASAPVANADTASDAEAIATETDTATDTPKAEGDDTGAAAGAVTKVSTKAPVKASPKAQVKADSPAKTVRDQVKSAVKKVTGGLKKDKAGTEKTGTEKTGVTKKAESSNDSAKGSDAE
ncbi:hypothetical protein H7H51_16575 [Mycolicibacterium farcinogenes]|nr:hypothetical protein [Mycolicibacterium farcinogenes]